MRILRSHEFGEERPRLGFVSGGGCVAAQHSRHDDGENRRHDRKTSRRSFCLTQSRVLAIHGAAPMNDTHHDIMFIPVINRFMGAHVKVSGVAEHRPAGRLKTTTRLDAWWITPTANPPYELIEADGRPSASIMYR